MLSGISKHIYTRHFYDKNFYKRTAVRLFAKRSEPNGYTLALLNYRLGEFPSYVYIINIHTRRFLYTHGRPYVEL